MLNSDHRHPALHPRDHQRLPGQWPEPGSHRGQPLLALSLRRYRLEELFPCYACPKKQPLAHQLRMHALAVAVDGHHPTGVEELGRPSSTQLVTAPQRASSTLPMALEPQRAACSQVAVRQAFTQLAQTVSSIQLVVADSQKVSSTRLVVELQRLVLVVLHALQSGFLRLAQVSLHRQGSVSMRLAQAAMLLPCGEVAQSILQVLLQVLRHLVPKAVAS